MSERQEFFNQNGYWVEKKVFSSDQMSELFTMFYDLAYSMLKRTGLSVDQFPTTSKVSYTNDMKTLDLLLLTLFKKNKDLMGEIYDTVSYSIEFLRFITDRRVESISKELLGINDHIPLYAAYNRIRIDPPEDERRTYGWHQEIFYTIPRTKFLQTWCPILRDTTVENGTIEICPRSQTTGIAKQTWNEIDGHALQIIVDDSEVAKFKQISLPMSVGDILFFDGHLFHKSGQNSTNDEVRFSLVGMFNDTSNIEFRCPKPNFDFRGITPKEHFKQYFDQSN